MIASASAEQLRGLRRAVSAGEQLPASTWQAFYGATGVPIIDGIGSTEMLHIFISAAGRRHRARCHGQGGARIRGRDLDDNGKPVPDGTIGRLAVKGPTGCRYLADDRQRSYVRDGWNLTGDSYLRDADGYFWYQARADDIIISAGYNIAGPEIEEALLLHPDVAECGVVGVLDETRGQIVKAYVVLRTAPRAPTRWRRGCRSSSNSRSRPTSTRARRLPVRLAADHDGQAAAVQAARGRGTGNPARSRASDAI